jgi:hypothetical protein
MRCPKCGYISFDQEEACTKCDASLAEISRSLTGTAVRVQESFFLASVLGQAGQQAASEEVEFDLAEAEEGIPMVDLSPFEQQEEAAVEEYTGISFTLPEEEAEEEQVVEAAAGEEEQPAELGTIDFTLGEEPAQEEELQPAAEEAAGLDLSLEEAEVAALETEESLPELELEMGSVAEESLELDAGLQPDIEEQALAEEPGAGKTAAAAGSGLDLDIDVDLEEDEPSDEEMVFNLEDIDMSDLVIDEPGGTEEETGRPEDTALNLEDFLSSGKGSDSGIPMDLNMEDVDLGDDEQDKKSADLPDIEL